MRRATAVLRREKPNGNAAEKQPGDSHPPMETLPRPQIRFGLAFPTRQFRAGSLPGFVAHSPTSTTAALQENGFAFLFRMNP
jgi:hypothetical protein